MGKLATAIEIAKIPIVPSTYVQMGGGAEGEGDGGGANAFNLLMTLLSTEKLQATGAPAAVDPDQAESVRAIKSAIREQMTAEANIKPTPKPAAPKPEPAKREEPKPASDTPSTEEPKP